MIETLKNKSGEAIYPLTSTKAVVDENGNTIEGRLVVADGEDLVTDGNVLRLKDRPNTDGMGYVILRKDKTFQEQVTKPNTIYEIRYDFDLNGAEITIPENCVLKFEGGSLRNGSVIYKDTYLEGKISHKAISEIRGKIKNSTITSDAFEFVEDYKKLDFLFSQIKDGVTLIINGNYDIDCSYLTFNTEKKEFSNGKYTLIASWKKFNKTKNIKISGNGVINISNYSLTKYQEILYFPDGLSDSSISLSVNGTTEYYKTNIDYGVNFLRIMGDSNNLQLNINSNRLANPLFYGDYYGNDGQTGLINSNIEVRGIGNKYGSRIHHASFCNIFIANEYAHRGLGLGGGISHCKIRVEGKYMDTSIGVLIGSTFVNNRQEGANNLYIELHDTGTVEDSNRTVVPLKVDINSYGGDIENGLFMRDYSIMYSDIEIVNTYSEESYVKSSILPFNLTQTAYYSGRDLVPKDIKKIKAKVILPDGAIVEGKSTLQVYNTYDGRFDDLELFYEVVNNSSNKSIIYMGGFAVNNDHKLTIKTDARITPTMYRVSLPYNDWLVTNQQYEGTFRLCFQSPAVYFRALSEEELALINSRDEALPEYVILNDVKTAYGELAIPRYTPSMTLYNNRGTTAERPFAVKGDMYFDTTLNKPLWWNGRGWVGAEGNIQRAGTWSQRPNADGSFLENGFQYFLLESEPDEDPDGNPIESLTGNGKAIWWIQDGRKWVDALGNTITGSLGITDVKEVRHIINGEEYKVLTTDDESHNATIYAPTELGNDNYVVAQQNDKAVFVDPADIGLK